jgi:hypothetical protein
LNVIVPFVIGNPDVDILTGFPTIPFKVVRVKLSDSLTVSGAIARFAFPCALTFTELFGREVSF